jgi:hypothetical protein
MKTQFPTAPPERLIEGGDDSLKSLRAVRGLYVLKAAEEKTDTAYYLNAASLVISTKAEIGQYHDYIATNQYEIVLNPTPEESDRILRESAIEIEGIPSVDALDAGA